MLKCVKLLIEPSRSIDLLEGVLVSESDRMHILTKLYSGNMCGKTRFNVGPLKERAAGGNRPRAKRQEILCNCSKIIIHGRNGALSTFLRVTSHATPFCPCNFFQPLLLDSRLVNSISSRVPNKNEKEKERKIYRKVSKNPQKFIDNRETEIPEFGKGSRWKISSTVSRLFVASACDSFGQGNPLYSRTTGNWP